MQTDFDNGRFAEYYGVFAAVADILQRMIIQSGKPMNFDFSRNLKDSVYRVLASNNNSIKERAPINLLVRSIFFLADSDNCYCEDDIIDYDSIFIIDNGSTFLVKEADLPDIVVSYAKKHAVPYVPMSSNELTKLLYDNDIVRKFKEGNRQRYCKKYAKFGRKRLLELNKEKMEMLL